MLCLLMFFQIYQITSQSKWHKVTNNSFVFAGMISRPTWFHPSNIWEMKSHSQMLHWHVTDRPVKLTKWFCQLALHTSRYVKLWKMPIEASDNVMTTKDSDWFSSGHSEIFHILRNIPQYGHWMLTKIQRDRLWCSVCFDLISIDIKYFTTKICPYVSSTDI